LHICFKIIDSNYWKIKKVIKFSGKTKLFILLAILIEQSCFFVRWKKTYKIVLGQDGFFTRFS